MKFVLFVEGHTEQRTIGHFLKRWLDARLEQRVGIKAVRFQGWFDMVNEMSKKVRMYFEGPESKDIIGVIGLLDLYGPTFYPDNATTVQERITWGKNEFERKVGRERFKMFFAVHEYEAWLLSQTDVFPAKVAKTLRSKIKQPEDVNFDNPPSKLLEQLYFQQTGRKYKKIAHGIQLFGKLDPERAAQKCPELRKMLETMLNMAQDAGS